MVPVYNIDGCGGFAEYSLNIDGEPEMTAFHTFENPMDNLKGVLKNYFHFENPQEVIESGYAEGFEIKPHGWKWTWLTVYHSQFPFIYTLYEAIPDVSKGVDIYDEKLILKGSLKEIDIKLNKLVKENQKDLQL